MSIGFARSKEKEKLSRQIAKDTEKFLKAGGTITICTSEDNASLRYEKENYSRHDFAKVEKRSRFNDDDKIVH